MCRRHRAAREDPRICTLGVRLDGSGYARDCSTTHTVKSCIVSIPVFTLRAGFVMYHRLCLCLFSAPLVVVVLGHVSTPNLTYGYEDH